MIHSLTMTANELRAEKGFRLMQIFRQIQDKDTDETDAIDAIADILHWCEEEAGDVDKICRCALEHFRAEIGGEL
jgi:hypothetical protein